jgi:hypothetical protein
MEQRGDVQALLARVFLVPPNIWCHLPVQPHTLCPSSSLASWNPGQELGCPASAFRRGLRLQGDGLQHSAC